MIYMYTDNDIKTRPCHLLHNAALYFGIKYNICTIGIKYSWGTCPLITQRRTLH